MAEAGTDTITTQVPSRLDRLPWSRFHWRVVIGLGSVWILDGLEVTMVGNVAARLTEDGSGLDISAAQIGVAGAIYIVGACLGALFFGQLTDRLGRKKLFLWTLVLYLVATVATAFSFSPWYFFLCRFLTGAGIGGEYAAINSAIDELIPARVRGRVDLIINGSYWLGSAAGSALSLVLLSTVLLPIDLGWRLAFGFGAVLGICVLIVRRHVPESPRWLFIHGREEEAERIVRGIEEGIEEERGEKLPAAEGSLTIRQRRAIPFREIAAVAFRKYPRRSILCLALFVGQAFLYNGITFNLGVLLSSFYDVGASLAPLFIIFWALSNFAGPVILGHFFDSVGRKPMITLAYLGSAVVTLPLAWVFLSQTGGLTAFMILLVITFFLASSGASAAYLTVSEIFPMETRALAIAFFYALGTAAGGIAGPLLFGSLIETGERIPVAIGFLIAAAVMSLGGVAELVFGVRAEGQELEDLATPLTAQEGDGPGDGDGERGGAGTGDRA
ncbi:putative MFS family arabinose efflux permease [Brachybacterium sp. AG952]|uniref:MFS transporter n=1 Tax=Brachybacterium sp. AG952 TaxID=2183989 RepID=UPI001061C868|nr:MFS transporter [Brachybacterium sp. AG952]TDP78966.1 putative MFS family arabinose efflux permease [Brachybacterium sp. AG952]